MKRCEKHNTLFDPTWEPCWQCQSGLAQARRDAEAAEQACIDLCAFIGVNGLDFNGPDWMSVILRAKDVVKAVNAARARLAGLEGDPPDA